MKRLLLITATFAALALLMPQIGLAQAHYNQLGIYSDPAGTPASANYIATVNVPFNAYLVLTNPLNETYNGSTVRSITNVSAFECKVIMPDGVAFNKVSETYPANAINMATLPEYVVGFASAVPVVSNAIVLCTWQFLVTDTSEYNIMMGLTRFPSIAGQMAIVDADDAQDPLSPVYVSTNDFSVPVFSINGNSAVAVDDASWGDVKALFR